MGLGKIGIGLGLAPVLIAGAVQAQVADRPSLSFYGMVGLIDMPSGEAMPEGELAATASYFAGTLRNTISFQVTPRLTASFRYSRISNFSPRVNIPVRDTYYDRSFDLRYQLAFEGRYRPAIAVGLQDFGGTGVYSAEYVVATKEIVPNVKVTGGIGWGRLASRNEFDNPLGIFGNRFDNRPGPRGLIGTGQISFKNWFRGPAALFAGVEWQTPVEGLTVKAEYSSDTYQRENLQGQRVFDQNSPLNFGAEYRFGNGSTLGLYYLYGSEVGLRFSTSINPKRPRLTGIEEAPLPVRIRQGYAGRTRSLFGEVIDGSDLPAGYGGQVPNVAVERSASGVRIARVQSGCSPEISRELDAQEGVVDLVIFESSPGQASCTVVLRPAGQAYIEAVSQRIETYDASPSLGQDQTETLIARLQSFLAAEKIIVEAASVTERTATVRIRNFRFDAPAQAIGRTARAMSQVLPDSVEEFVIIPVLRGVPVSKTRIARSDLETLENDPDGSWRSFTRAKIDDVPTDEGKDVFAPGLYPKVSTWIGPYAATNLFDPVNPVRVDLGLRAGARWDITPGLSLNGQVSQKLIGNIDEVRRNSNSVIQRVRTDIDKYQRGGDFSVDRVTLDYLFKVSPDVYGRLSAGIFELMYGGVSAEVLWKPVNSRLAFGAEINHVKQRDFDKMFGFRDYEVTTGHISAYWDMGNGFETQVDAGRYLAKDWGATFTLDRVFKNGWRVGGYFTITDVSAEDFGEGSFDKGIRVSVPWSWVIGQPTRRTYGTTIQPLLRDGGARVNVPERLYPIVKGYDRTKLKDSWGRFLR